MNCHHWQVQVQVLVQDLELQALGVVLVALVALELLVFQLIQGRPI